VNRFRELIGEIIHSCGVLEFVTNLSIKRLGKDSLLSNEIITLSFVRRIRILRDLLHERTPLRHEEVDSLCDELLEFANLRNAVAHNPIATYDWDNEDAESFIVRPKFDSSEYNKITEAELQPLPERLRAATHKLALWVPESTIHS
jgi:hypothetical protein